MVEDATVRKQMESANEGKMQNDNCMPAWSINMSVNSYIFILYGRG